MVGLSVWRFAFRNLMKSYIKKFLKNFYAFLVHILMSDSHLAESLKYARA